MAEEPREGRLVLQDGRTLIGRVFGAPRSAHGEVVFNTGMVGYPESLTDPSYRGQILVMTYPLVGNYGVPARDREDPLAPGFESESIQARALVVSSQSQSFSHWQAASSLDAWLKEEGIPALECVDTRALTKWLRKEGTKPAKLIVEGDPEAEALQSGPFEHIEEKNLVAEVSTKEPIAYGDGKKRVILLDCGVKRNIIRSLVRRGVSVLRVPWDTDLSQTDGDGILVSNGPGDPTRATAAIESLRGALAQDRPIFGVCMGNQLLGLAAGARIFRLKFGHRGHNQPCRELGGPRCYITSQNHGYALDPAGLPPGWEPWFVNANDGSNEGIRHLERPFSAVQFHPEATPGPVDTAFLFDRFVESLS